MDSSFDSHRNKIRTTFPVMGGTELVDSRSLSSIASATNTADMYPSWDIIGDLPRVKDVMPYVINTGRSLFGRWSMDFSALLMHILYQCKFKTICSLRLVSKGFYYSSMFLLKGPQCSPWDEKVCRVLFPNLVLKAEFENIEKFINNICLLKETFNKNKVNYHNRIFFETTIKDLIDFESKFESILDFIKDAMIGFTLDVDISSDLFHRNRKKIYTLLQQYINSVRNLTIRFNTFSYKNKESDNVEANQMINLFPNLNSLCIEDLPHCNLALNNLFNLSELVIKTQISSILHAESESTIQLSSSLNNLKKLVIEGFTKGQQISLPTILPNLKILTIKSLEKNATFNLNVQCPNLKIITIENIQDGSMITLPNLLNKLTELTIATIWNASIFLPTELTNLRNLNILCFADIATFGLETSIKNLTKLLIRCIRENDSVSISSDMFPNLQECSIEMIAKGACLDLSGSFPNLISFSVIEMEDGSRLKLPNEGKALPKLSNFLIFAMGRGQGVTVKLPDSLDKLDLNHIIIGYLDDYSEPGSNYKSYYKSLESEILKQAVYVIKNTLVPFFKYWHSNHWYKYCIEDFACIMDEMQVSSHHVYRPRKEITLIYFAQKYPDWAKLVAHILLNCDLTTILALRLVSKGFYDLTSIPNSKFSCTPLAYRAVVSLNANDFLSRATKDLRDKSRFIDTNKIETRLKITNQEQFKQLQVIFNAKIQQQFKQINIINCEQLSLDESQLKTFFHNFQNQSFQLNEFSFGNIRDNTPIYVPESIAKMKIGKIQKDTKISIDPLKNSLSKLIIGDVWNKAKLDLKDLTFANLLSLTMGNIGHYAVIDLPKSFKYLQTMNLGNIGSGVNLEFSDSCSNVKSLEIGNIEDGAILKLSGMNNLESLSIKNIHDRATIELPSLDKVAHLCIGNIGKDLRIKWPTSLKSLKTLTIGCIFPNAIFYLPDQLDNLYSVTIGNISAKFKLGETLKNLRNLSIENVEDVLELPQVLDELKSFKIGNVYKSAMVKLPQSMKQISEFKYLWVEDESLLEQMRLWKEVITNRSSDPI